MFLLKKIGNLFVALVLIAIAAPLLLMVFLLYILAYPFRQIQNQQGETKFLYFLNSITGEQFIFYTNNKKTRAFIELNVIQFLSPKTRVVFLDGKTYTTTYSGDYRPKMAAIARNEGRPPWLMKVINGKLYCKSINNAVYNTISQKKDTTNLLAEIEQFYTEL